MQNRRSYKKPPVREVTVLTTDKNVEVYFEFDKKIVDMMHNFGGGQFKPSPRKHWMFPLNRKEEIIRSFRSKKYYVYIMRKRKDFPNEPDVFSVLGKCPNCGRYGDYYSDGTCMHCCGNQSHK